MKPISEWTAAELRRTGNGSWTEEAEEFAAEVLRLRSANAQLAYDKREIAALFEADHDGWKSRAEKAEAELAQVRAAYSIALIRIEDLRNECHHVDALGRAEAEIENLLRVNNDLKFTASDYRDAYARHMTNCPNMDGRR